MAQLLFENAALLDIDVGLLRPGTSVLVEDERIVEVSEGSLRAPDARRIDCGGRTLMPGLIDAHVHCAITTMDLAAMERRPLTLVAQEARVVLEQMLQRGFTTVRDAGGAMGFGTDLLGETHAQQNREFGIRARVLPAVEVLRSATRVNARILGREGELGIVAPGALADLLVIDGDPLADISVLERPEQSPRAVVRGGELLVDRLD